MCDSAVIEKTTTNNSVEKQEQQDCLLNNNNNSNNNSSSCNKSQRIKKKVLTKTNQNTKQNRFKQQEQQQQESSEIMAVTTVSTNNNSSNVKRETPKIVTRVNSIPVVNKALSLGFSQYDKLKSSNATVGDVMNRAETLVVYFWQKVQPIVDKLQDPITKADQFACSTLDFVEDILGSRIPQSVDSIVAKYKPALKYSSLATPVNKPAE